MKVSGIQTFPVEPPPPYRGGRKWLFLRVDTDADVSGYGEVMLLGSAFALPVVAAMVEDVAQQYLVGHDPYNIEAAYDRMYSAGYSHYPEQTKLGIMSGLEMACWDIIGKDVGQPVHRLLGGAVRDRLRTYTYVWADLDDPELGGERPSALWVRPEATAERARHYADLGFTGLKFDPLGLPIRPEQRQGQVVPIEYSLDALETATETVRLVRQAVGNRCDIMIGTHGQLTAAGAIRLARRLEPFDPLWLEEPVPPENVGEMAKVARGTTIPITTGERLTTKYDFARLIEHQAAAIFNLDVAQVGGILESKKIAAMAEAHYLQITPHVYGGPLVAAASVQLSLCCPNFLIMESMERFDGIHAELVEPRLEWRDGYVIPSERPGLGHDLCEDAAARYAPS